MFKRVYVRALKSACTAFEINTSNRRTFLSNAYQCQEVWNHKLYHELEQNYQQTKNISAVDVDIFANAVVDETHLDELQDLVHKLRLSAESSNTLKSTGHALVRAFVAHDRTERLLDILDDRINYGVFLDRFDANVLMDEFLKRKDHFGAAKVAVQLMLQEDLSHDLSRNLAALSCYLCLKDPVERRPPVPTSDAREEPREEIKARVKFLRNPYFDDHFDLRDPARLIGKTLVAIGSVGNGPIDDSLLVVGLASYGKHDRLADTLKRFELENRAVYPETKTFLKDVPAALESVGRLRSERGSIEEKLVENVERAVVERSETDVVERCRTYEEWEAIRRRAIDEQIARLDRANGLKNIAEIETDLKDRERHLRFFENEERIDLQIDSNKVFYRKRWFGKKKKPRKVDVDYLPPEIGSRRD